MSSTRDRYNPYSPGSSGWSILKNEEFQEADLWGREIDSYSTARISSSSIFSQRQQPPSTAALMIPKPIVSSCSPPIMNEPNTFQQSSAPVNIPKYWSKIYGKNPSGDDDGGGGGGENNSSWDSDEDEEMMVPPHEWIARKLARSQISSFSVYEGIGRTLKGRDLSNVRNAVLTKTGFLE